jgi:hypothetical protein
VDESVCHLQDSSFQVSLVPEKALPVSVGMGWLGCQIPIGRTPSAEVKFRLISSLHKASSYSTPTSEKVRSRAGLSRITWSRLFLFGAGRVITRILHGEWIQCVTTI